MEAKKSGKVLPINEHQKVVSKRTTFCFKLGVQMEIYVANTSYVDYLRKFDSNVMINDEDGRVRKYVGIIYKINSFNYFVPLSSPKQDKDYIKTNGKLVVRGSVIPIHRIVIRQGNNVDFLGKLLFSNMIPIPDSEITLLDIDSITDEKYRNLLNKQVIYIRKNRETLQKKHAEVIYKQKINNYPNIGYLNNTVDFKLLEQKMLEYVAAKEIVEGKEQASAYKEK